MQNHEAEGSETDCLKYDELDIQSLIKELEYSKGIRPDVLLQGKPKPGMLRKVAWDVLYNNALKGNLVVAPVDMSLPGKKILDFSQETSTWLRGVRSKQTAEHEYHGRDIVSELLQENTDDITYVAEPFKEQPQHYKGTFDLVHVHESMIHFAPDELNYMMKDLTSLLKPGGWIQLAEPNISYSPENGNAMTEYTKLLCDLWTSDDCADLATANRLLLEKADLRNVEQKRFIIKLGKVADPLLEKISVHGMTEAVGETVSSAMEIPPTFYNRHTLHTLPKRVRRELKRNGGEVELIITYGQKSASLFMRLWAWLASPTRFYHRLTAYFESFFKQKSA